MGDYEKQALAWLDKDPDEATRSQLRSIIDKKDNAALQQAFGQRLSFGTAGLRGLMGLGFGNMNVSIV